MVAFFCILGQTNQRCPILQGSNAPSCSCMQPKASLRHFPEKGKFRWHRRFRGEVENNVMGNFPNPRILNEIAPKSLPSGPTQSQPRSQCQSQRESRGRRTGAGSSSQILVPRLIWLWRELHVLTRPSSTMFASPRPRRAGCSPGLDTS